MPHLTLEYSSNVNRPADLAALFHELHAVLLNTGGIEIENCKSRGHAVEDFLVGSGGESGAFVHLDVRFLEGRAPGLKQRIGRELHAVLMRWFHDAVDHLDVQITVEVHDILRAFYFKYPEGTFTQL